LLSESKSISLAAPFVIIFIVTLFDPLTGYGKQIFFSVSPVGFGEFLLYRKIY